MLITGQMLYSVTMSLDGFISGPGGDMSWLTEYLEPNPMVDALVAFAHSPAGQKILDIEGYTPLEQKK